MGQIVLPASPSAPPSVEKLERGASCPSPGVGGRLEARVGPAVPEQMLRPCLHPGAPQSVTHPHGLGDWQICSRRTHSRTNPTLF